MEGEIIMKQKSVIDCNENQVIVPLSDLYHTEINQYLKKVIPDIKGYANPGWVFVKPSQTSNYFFENEKLSTTTMVTIETFDQQHKRSTFPVEQGPVRLTFRCIGCKNKFMKGFTNYLLSR
jgi:hypothetical protein